MDNPPFIHETAIVDEGARIGSGTKIWHFTHVMSKSVIGNNCILGQNIFVANNVTIGDKTKIQNNVSLYEGVTCEAEVFIGPSAVFTNVINPRSFVERKTEFLKTLVRRGASIGANATIICGNSLGRYSFVGAGTVVNRDVKDFELVVGNPCRHIGYVSKLGNKLLFENGFCEIDGDRYVLENNTVKIA